jgi:hypothetical protein
MEDSSVRKSLQHRRLYRAEDSSGRATLPQERPFSMGDSNLVGKTFPCWRAFRMEDSSVRTSGIVYRWPKRLSSSQKVTTPAKYLWPLGLAGWLGHQQGWSSLSSLVLGRPTFGSEKTARSWSSLCFSDRTTMLSCFCPLQRSLQSAFEVLATKQTFHTGVLDDASGRNAFSNRFEVRCNRHRPDSARRFFGLWTSPESART